MIDCQEILLGSQFCHTKREKCNYLDVDWLVCERLFHQSLALGIIRQFTCLTMSFDKVGDC